MLIPDIFEKYKLCIPHKGILHIGAHICEERNIYNSINMTDDKVLWIEAISEIVDKVKKENSNINIINAVITDKDNEDINFMITNNYQSSSIFNFETHLKEHPEVIEIARRQLKSITINTIFDNNNFPYDKFDFINLDLQGAELKALKGATKILPYIKSIYCEVNIKKLYDGAVLLPELDEFLNSYRFKRVETIITCHGWGDALYIKY